MIELFEIIWKWKWKIGGVAVLAGLIAIIVSMPRFMPPYYSSTTIFYPSNPALMDRAVMFNQESGDSYQDYFGNKNDIDRILSIGNSGGLYNFLIEKYNLMEHYGIDVNKVKFANFAVVRELQGNYKAIKTDLGSIAIKILDKDPDIAARMANDAADYVDRTNKALLAENKNNAIKILQGEMAEKAQIMKEITDSLVHLSNTYSIYIAPNGHISGTDENAAQNYKVLNTRLNRLIFQTNDLEELMGQYAVSAKNDFSTLYYIEKAVANEVKAKPIRWMILAGAVIGTLLFMILLAVLIEGIRSHSNQ